MFLHSTAFNNFGAKCSSLLKIHRNSELARCLANKDCVFLLALLSNHLHMRRETTQTEQKKLKDGMKGKAEDEATTQGQSFDALYVFKSFQRMHKGCISQPKRTVSMNGQVKVKNVNKDLHRDVDGKMIGSTLRKKTNTLTRQKCLLKKQRRSPD